MNERVIECPSCRNNDFSVFLSTKDYFFSNLEFEIVKCNKCRLKFTNPRPSQNEIGKYYQSDEYISHDTTRKSLSTIMYLLARKINIKNKYNLIQRYNAGKTVLDFGCGTGEFLAYCKKMGMETTGIEPSEKARNYAITHHGLNLKENLNLLKDDSLYDIITLWHSLEHVADLMGTLGKIKRLLSSNGLLVIAVPNSNSWDAKKYGKYWAAFDLPRHFYHFNKDTLTQTVISSGFRVKSILPQKMDAFYISLMSEKYQKGKMEFIKAIVNGCRSNLNASREMYGYSSMIFLLEHKNL